MLLAVTLSDRTFAHSQLCTSRVGRRLARRAPCAGELRWERTRRGCPYVFQDPMDPNHLIGFRVDLAAEIARF